MTNLASSRRCTGNPDIAFFLQNLAGGGAERAIVALANEISGRGFTVDLVLGEANNDYSDEIAPSVVVHEFDTRSKLHTLCRLIQYLRRRNPSVVMSALDSPNILLVMASKLAGYKGRTVVSQRAVVDASLWELPPLRRLVMRLLLRVSLPRADAVISNSHAAANDVRSRYGIPADRVVTIQNSVHSDAVIRFSNEHSEERAFLGVGRPLIVSVGSLTLRKDMATLIRAFSIVRERYPAWLVIVGKGSEEGNIRRLVGELGLTAEVHLLGFDRNPYKWMAAAAVFVSSSTGEGFPNVIAETLALGRPIVATDCPGDTAELLGHGKWGRLVPVGDSKRMADAIMSALEDQQPVDGRIRAADFAPEKITNAYIAALLPKRNVGTHAFRKSV
jgi:glycosyltransferase involved in cell wall biosynthesis